VNQFNWTYLADNGKHHQVVLMHGATSGHLLVYCNTSILLIDFGVLKTSSYSFFIEEELCELRIVREGDEFSYGFDVNREADTPLNNARKEKEKKYLYQSLFFMGGLMFIVSLFIVGLTFYHKNQDQSKLMDQLLTVGKETSARIVIDPNDLDAKITSFFFANGTSYSASTKLTPSKETSPILLNSGMPLENGDEFLVRYLPEAPQRNLIDFDKPTAKTLEKYQNRAIHQYLLKNPELSQEEVKCLVETAFALKSIEGYALFYFSTANSEVNINHNINTFNRLYRDLPFQEAIAKNCQNF